jgi:hypothetical protein
VLTSGCCARDSLLNFWGEWEDEGGPNEKCTKDESGGKKYTWVCS